jgi:hypothetical protein
MPLAISMDEDRVNWESTREFDNVCQQIGRNRKLLLDLFEHYKQIGDTVLMEKCKDLLQTVLREYQLSDWKYYIIMKVAMKDGRIFYRQLLDIYKNRFSSKNLFPKSYNI